MFRFEYCTLTKKAALVPSIAKRLFWLVSLKLTTLGFAHHDFILWLTKGVNRNSVDLISRCCQSLFRCLTAGPPFPVHFRIFGPERDSLKEKQKLGHPCFRNPLVCMCKTQATSTINALQTATSFRHTFKGKVTSSHYTTCTHYAELYIDPSFICRMCTSLYIN